MEYFDIAVIGGGASGLAAAITAKRKAPKARICIFEALDRVGKKLITTGNGRCNITNRKLTPDHFHSERPDFSSYALGRFGNETILSFFDSIGIPVVFEGDKGYPASLQAASVVDCLRFECERLGIETRCGCRIEDITFGKTFRLFAKELSAEARAVICATGLYSGGEKVGSDGGFFRLLKEKGFKSVRLSPSIVQLKTETDFVKQLKGIKTDALATLLQNGKPFCREFGEVLFCDYGLSGPAIMNISREVGRSENRFAVSLDLFPENTEDELSDRVLKRTGLLSDRTLEDFFTGMLNKRLGQVVLKISGFKLSDKVSILTPKDAIKLSKSLKNLIFPVVGNTGFINSQVTAGGISTDEFSNRTLMSKRFPGLFACGELLDVDGDCGGFNLAWCWAGGILAAEEAVLYIGERYDTCKQPKTPPGNKL